MAQRFALPDDVWLRVAIAVILVLSVWTIGMGVALMLESVIADEGHRRREARKEKGGVVIDAASVEVDNVTLPRDAPSPEPSPSSTDQAPSQEDPPPSE